MDDTNSLSHTLLNAVNDPGQTGPLYRRIAQTIAALIQSSELPAQTVLPPERDLAEALKIGRVTVRNAYKELISSGLVEQRQGSGTFVAERPGRITQPLWRLSSFSEDMRSRGKTPGSRVLQKLMTMPSPEEAFGLGIRLDARVLRLNRLRLADGRPVALERAAVPAVFLEESHFDGDSLYASLERRGFRPVHALQRLSAVLADSTSAERMEIETNSPALQIIRISRLADGRAVEYTHSLYRGDAYDFVAELRIGDKN
jgi:GntR family transcriptional regulator